jgi:SAM-dependent methyltransferase
MEENIKELLRNHLILKGYKNLELEKNIKNLMSVENSGYQDRLNFFLPYLKKNTDFDSIFCSGCSIGSELILAKKYFKECVGLEIDKELAKIGNLRLKNFKGTSIFFSENGQVPFKNKLFSLVYSAHVIEHTYNPFKYFLDLINLVKPEGFLFLEFPNRYNLIELHTNTISFEWANNFFRTIFLNIAIFVTFFYNKEKSKNYKLVLKTLKQISISLIKKFILISKIKCEIIATQKPAKGYVRLLIKKY